jgi:hypothetical protein
MRTRWWAFLCLAVLTCAAAYQHFTPSSLPTEPVQSELQPVAQAPAQPLAQKDEERLPDVVSAPAGVAPRQEARLEDATAPVEPSALKETKPDDLSYLAFYAYSELPPDPKPADIVLNALKDIPPGTPVDEIKRVSDLLRLDYTFMKTVAKIESGFNPQQRTGSYIGLFQLSKHEFGKYGSGDILLPRNNTIAAALKFMTEGALFLTFTHKKPTPDDLYLIHQQGIDGAAEHISHPRRLAWRSMCATEEGKEKGARWCKLAIWGNTTPAVKKIWKNVNKVTSGEFVTMWRQRVSEFYGIYSAAAAN